MEFKEFKNYVCLSFFFFFKLYEMGKNYFKNILPDYSQRVCKMHLAATIYICGKRSESTSKRGVYSLCGMITAVMFPPGLNLLQHFDLYTILNTFLPYILIALADMCRHTCSTQPQRIIATARQRRNMYVLTYWDETGGVTCVDLTKYKVHITRICLSFLAHLKSVCLLSEKSRWS